MEKTVIKMVNEHYMTNNDIVKLIKYIAAEGRNKERENLLCCKGRGVSNKANKAIVQMIAIQKLYEKEDKRRMYQLIVSFSKDMHDKSAIKAIADEISNIIHENYQVFYGIHLSHENWHIHFAINAVSYRTGKKWHQNKQEFAEMKCLIYDIINIM